MPSAGWMEVSSRPFSRSLEGSPGSTRRSPCPQPSLDGSPPTGLVRSFNGPGTGSQEGFKEDSRGFSESLEFLGWLGCRGFRGEGCLAPAPLGEGSRELAARGEGSWLWLGLWGKESCMKVGACARGDRSLVLGEAR